MEKKKKKGGGGLQNSVSFVPQHNLNKQMKHICFKGIPGRELFP